MFTDERGPLFSCTRCALDAEKGLTTNSPVWHDHILLFFPQNWDSYVIQDQLLAEFFFEQHLFTMGLTMKRRDEATKGYYFCDPTRIQTLR